MSRVTHTPADAVERTVQGTVLTSAAMPAAQIEFASSLTYVGAQTIRLSGSTRAEQHFFVASDGSRIERLYWVQLEGKPDGATSVRALPAAQWRACG